MGNSTRVAEKSYLLVTEQDFTKAIHPPDVLGSDEAAQKAAQLDQKTAQNAAQQGLAASTQGNEETPENTGENTVSSVLSGVLKAEDTGLEPAAPYGVPQFQ